MKGILPKKDENVSQKELLLNLFTGMFLVHRI